MDFNGKQVDVIAEEQKDIDGHVTEDHVHLEVSITRMQQKINNDLCNKKVRPLIKS